VRGVLVTMAASQQHQQSPQRSCMRQVSAACSASDPRAARPC
jgi:hypothetical protein